MVFLVNVDWYNSGNNNVRHNNDIPLHKNRRSGHEFKRMSNMLTTNKRFNKSINNKHDRIQKLK